MRQVTKIPGNYICTFFFVGNTTISFCDLSFTFFSFL